MADGKKKKSGKKTGPDWSWILFIFVITMVISAAMSFISSRLLGNAGMAVSFLILICIVAIGIVFDIIGVAVTACPEAPFHAMASRKVAEAPDALRLLRTGGVLVSDNVLQDGDIIESHYAVERRNRTIYKRMREYLYVLKHTDGLLTSIVPVGDGAAVTVKQKDTICL